MHLKIVDRYCQILHSLDVTPIHNSNLSVWSCLCPYKLIKNKIFNLIFLYCQMKLIILFIFNTIYLYLLIFYSKTTLTVSNQWQHIREFWSAKTALLKWRLIICSYKKVTATVAGNQQINLYSCCSQICLFFLLFVGHICKCQITLRLYHFTRNILRCHFTYI